MRRSLELELMDFPGQPADILEEDLGTCAQLITISARIGQCSGDSTGS